jgi:DNA-binding transcriptional regulator YdaS (Cro superfamily)
MSDVGSTGEKVSRKHAAPQDRAAIARAVRQIKRSPALHTKYLALRTALAEATTDELVGRYAVGQIAGEIREGGARYGSGALRLVARVLGVSQSSLYDATSVVAAFPPTQLPGLRERKNAFGVPLSFSHLVLLARVKPSARRAALLERAYTDGLTERQLRVELLGKPAERAVDPAVAVRRAVRLAQSLGRQAAALAAAVGALKGSGGDESLREFREAHAALAKFIADTAPLVAGVDADGEEAGSRVGVWGQRRGEA